MKTNWDNLATTEEDYIEIFVLGCRELGVPEAFLDDFTPILYEFDQTIIFNDVKKEGLTYTGELNLTLLKAIRNGKNES